MSFFNEFDIWVDRGHQTMQFEPGFTQLLVKQFHGKPCWKHQNELSSLPKTWFLIVKVWFYEFFQQFWYFGGQIESKDIIWAWVYPTFI